MPSLMLYVHHYDTFYMHCYLPFDISNGISPPNHGDALYVVVEGPGLSKCIRIRDGHYSDLIDDSIITFLHASTSAEGEVRGEMTSTAPTLHRSLIGTESLL